MSLFFENATLGQYGAVVRTDTTTETATSGKVWCAIQVVSDAKFNTLTDIASSTYSSRLANTTLASAITIPAGVVIYGKFSSFKLHQGAVIAYYGS